MVKVKSAQERKDAYTSAIGAVPGKYAKGIASTQGWKEAALSGQDLYVQKMNDAEVLSRRERGLQRTSEQTWKTNASTLGAQRIGAGMQAGADKQVQNYEPFAQALGGLQLAPRTADPMQNIDNRVKAVVATMVEVKRPRSGG